MSSPDALRLYRQVPFNFATSEIRLLTVHQATNRDAALECQLSVVSLGLTGDYDSLSYHWWGDTGYPMIVNGITLDIRVNLFNALRFLRYPNRPRVLWVDAICINQADDGPDGEVSKQLPLMRRIYQQSTRTVAYFGRETTADGGAHTLAPFIERLRRGKRRLESARPNIEPDNNNAVCVPTADEFIRHGIPRPDEIGYRTLGSLLRSSWTKRAWVIQEVAVAKEVLIQWGPYTFRMEDIAEAALFVWAMGFDTEDACLPATHLRSIWAECVKQKLDQRGTLLSLVIRHWLSSATKPHDKIYALCGLSRDSGPDGLSIQFDYTKSPDDVYTDFARSILTTYRNLDIFSALTPSHPEARSKGLSSWAPDWNADCFVDGTLIYRRPEPMPEPGPCRVLFTATNTTLSSPRFSSGGCLLILDGYILDTIVTIGLIRPASFTNEEMVRILLEWRNTVAQCDDRKKQTLQTDRTASCRSLLSHHDHGQRQRLSPQSTRRVPCV